MKSLSATDLKAYELYKQGKLTQSEIADKLGVSCKGISQRIAKVKQMNAYYDYLRSAPEDVGNLGVSPRAVNRMYRRNIYYISQLNEVTSIYEVRRMCLCGDATAKEIWDALNKFRNKP